MKPLKFWLVSWPLGLWRVTSRLLAAETRSRTGLQRRWRRCSQALDSEEASEFLRDFAAPPGLFGGQPCPQRWFSAQTGWASPCRSSGWSRGRGRKRKLNYPPRSPGLSGSQRPWTETSLMMGSRSSLTSPETRCWRTGTRRGCGGQRRMEEWPRAEAEARQWRRPRRGRWGRGWRGARRGDSGKWGRGCEIWPRSPIWGQSGPWRHSEQRNDSNCDLLWIAKTQNKRHARVNWMTQGSAPKTSDSQWEGCIAADVKAMIHLIDQWEDNTHL